VFIEERMNNKETVYVYNVNVFHSHLQIEMWIVHSIWGMAKAEGFWVNWCEQIGRSRYKVLSFSDLKTIMLVTNMSWDTEFYKFQTFLSIPTTTSLQFLLLIFKLLLNWPFKTDT
jgi:hypothetical protein